MLVFSRKRNEGFWIGEDVRVVIVEVRGDKVRIGVEAPTEVPVHRDEVFEIIQRERKEGKA